MSIVMVSNIWRGEQRTWHNNLVILKNNNLPPVECLLQLQTDSHYVQQTRIYRGRHIQTSVISQSPTR